MMNSVQTSGSNLVSVAAKHTINALILDDDKFDRAKIRRLFNSSGIPFVLNEADTLKTPKQWLDAAEFDIVLIDYNLSYGTGLDALKLIQRHPKNSNAATIMITGDDRSTIAVEALKTGCKDYVSKNDLSATELKSKVQFAIERSGFKNSDEGRWRENMDNLTEVIVANYAHALQPQIAKILQEMQMLRTSIGHPDVDPVKDLENLERQCMDLWLSLTDTNNLDVMP
jgi:DNA-binding NarL/FixJ family response regulator